MIKHGSWELKKTPRVAMMGPSKDKHKGTHLPVKVLGQAVSFNLEVRPTLSVCKRGKRRYEL